MREYSGVERRNFVRLDYATPVACKVCKKETLDMLLRGYTTDISESGVLCKVSQKVNENDILWISFDRTALCICEELEKKALIYQNGVIGKVVRVEEKGQGHYDLGIQFVTREEENLTNIYPKVHFIKEGQIDNAEEE